MEQGPSWEANNSSASQEISRVFWYPRVHYRVHRSPPLVPIPEPDQSSPGHRSVLKIHFNKSSHVCLDLPSGLIPSDFPIKTPYMSQPHSPCFFLYYHLNYILSGVLTMQLFIMPSPPVPYYLVPPRPIYLPQYPILRHPQPIFLSQYETIFHTNIKGYNYISVYLHFWIGNKNVNIVDRGAAGNPRIQSALN
jgi:hypothetical protein